MTFDSEGFQLELFVEKLIQKAIAEEQLEVVLWLREQRQYI